MGTKKITDLEQVTSISANDLMYVVQENTSKNASIGQIYDYVSDALLSDDAFTVNVVQNIGSNAQFPDYAHFTLISGGVTVTCTCDYMIGVDNYDLNSISINDSNIPTYAKMLCDYNPKTNTYRLYVKKGDVLYFPGNNNSNNGKQLFLFPLKGRYDESIDSSGQFIDYCAAFKLKATSDSDITIPFDCCVAAIGDNLPNCLNTLNNINLRKYHAYSDSGGQYYYQFIYKYGSLASHNGANNTTKYIFPAGTKMQLRSGNTFVFAPLVGANTITDGVENVDIPLNDFLNVNVVNILNNKLSSYCDTIASTDLSTDLSVFNDQYTIIGSIKCKLKPNLGNVLCIKRKKLTYKYSQAGKTLRITYNSKSQTLVNEKKITLIQADISPIGWIKDVMTPDRANYILSNTFVSLGIFSFTQDTSPN